MFIRPMIALAVWVLSGALAIGQGAAPGRIILHGHVPAATARLTPNGRLPATHQLHLAIGLPLRNQSELDDLLRQLYDPTSPNFHQFITPPEFAARFGPTETDYAAVRAFLETNGFTVTGAHPNRVVLDVAGGVAAVERTFGVTLHTYRHPTEARDFFAPDTEPSLAAPVTLLHVSGLDNYALPHPHLKLQPLAALSNATPRSGSGPGGSYRGNDFRAAYVPGTALTGAGQSVGLLQYDGYYSNDIASYISQAGITTSVVLTNIAVNGGVSSPGGGSVEVSLDIEMAISMAPGLNKIYVYEAPNGFTAWSTILSKMANDNLAKQLSSSWGGGSPDATSEQIFKQMAAQGQTFFNASGDSDAFTGSVPFPSDSTNITQVGGTTLTTTSAGGSYVSETAWNWGNGTGSSGGVSTYYTIPSWQTNVSMAANGGSTTYRNIPDVALTGDNVNVVFSNGVSGSVGGTSCAAPLWAGFTALVNQQAALALKPPVGFLNPAIYAMGTGANYNTSFHDTTTGNNTSTASPSKYYAVAGYDLCTGWGTPNGTNFINVLVPLSYFASIAGAGWTLLAESATPANGAIDPGETVTVNFTLQNSGNLSTTNLVATLLSNAGVLAPSGPQTYGALAANGGSTNRPFTFTASGICGSNIVATLQLQDGTTNLGSVSFALPLGKPVPVQSFAQNFDGVTRPALPAGWTSTNISGTVNSWITTNVYDSAPNSVFVADVGSTSENALVSPVISVASGGAQLSFRHNFSFEYRSASSRPNRDGGVLEIKVGTGTFADIVTAGGSFAAGGYNGSISTTSNPLGIRSAWINNSGGWKTVIVNLPSSAAGQNIQLRWICGTDSGNSGTGAVGWYVDSLSVTDSVLNCSSVLADLAVSQSISSNSLVSGQNLVYTLTVTNAGPQPAANVVVTDAVPANITYISAPSGNYSAGNVVFSAGMLAAGTATNFFITLAPVSGIVFTNVASVATVTPEVTLTNNRTALIATQSVPSGPAITLSPVAQTIQCGSDASFTVAATGTTPLVFQWSLDGLALPAATNTSLWLTNVHLPSHTVTVVVTDFYGSVTSSVPLTVQDTLPPIITLNSTNPFYLELGSAYAEPGATAYDVCAGVVPVTTSGLVNANAVGTNLVTYASADGNGNTNFATRIVNVRDTTPPTIKWSFTNLVLAADINCGALMPDVTGTNYLVATDLSAPLTVLQVPTNNSVLSLGTNLVVLAVADAFNNTAYSTNEIVVVDQTPPQILIQPQSQTNTIGGTASFSVAASACTPLAFQWFFNDLILSAQTNSSLILSNINLSSGGNYSVAVTASGGSSTSLVAVLTVNLLPSTVALTSLENPSGFNDSLNFTASITPTNATGTVTFFTNGTVFDLQTLAAGTAVSASLASLPRGTNFVTAVYSGDLNDLPATNSLAQIVTNHPPAVAPAFYSLVAGFNLNIAVADLATNWSDADDDTLSLVGINLSTNGVVLADAGKFLIYSNANYVDDQFTCIISDGFGGTNCQTVTIAVVPQTNSTPAIAGLAIQPASGVTLKLAGGSGLTYVLESIVDLTSGNWQPVATNTLDITGTWRFTDFGVTNDPARFYRLKQIR